MFFYMYMYIAPGQGQTILCGQNSDVNRKALSLCSFVASSKKNISKVGFYTYFCLFFIHVYSSGVGADNPWGQNFHFNINLLPLWSFAVSFFY